MLIGRNINLMVCDIQSDYHCIAKGKGLFRLDSTGSIHLFSKHASRMFPSSYPYLQLCLALSMPWANRYIRVCFANESIGPCRSTPYNMGIRTRVSQPVVSTYLVLSRNPRHAFPCGDPCLFVRGLSSL